MPLLQFLRRLRRPLAALSLKSLVAAQATSLAAQPRLHPALAVSPSAAAAAPPPAPTPDAPAGPGAQRTVAITLKDLGVAQPLMLQTTHGEAGIPYNVRGDEVVKKAQLELNFAYSPALLPDLSHMIVLLNGEVVATIDLVKETSGGVSLTIPVDPALFRPKNQLNFRFIGHYTRDCEDPLHSSLWANVSNTRTKLDLTLQKVSRSLDLARLPAPFFDASDPTPLKLPFVFLDNPSDRLLAAAGAVSSWFGLQASYRGFTFPVSMGALPDTDAVVITHSGAALPGGALPDFGGPTVTLMPNPRNPYASLLVIGGRSDDETLAAARALASASSGLSGARTVVTPVETAARRPYDAPRWLRTDRPVRLGDFVQPERLEGFGLHPGLITVDSRVAPDLFFWPRGGPTLTVGYRYPAMNWLDFNMSRLDVLMNNKYLHTFPLKAEGRVEGLRDEIGAPAAHWNGTMETPAYALFGADQLQFYYDLRVLKQGYCKSDIPDNVRVSIDSDSKLDLSRAHHFARLPNLAFFASSGFPYTRMADQSETLVVMSAQPSAAEIESFLEMNGRFGDSTGFPSLKLAVARPGEVQDYAGKDVVLLGPTSLLAGVPELAAGAPLEVQQNSLRVRAANLIDRTFALFGSNVTDARRARISEVLVSGAEPSGLMAWRSPADPRRVVTAVFATHTESLPAVLTALSDPKTNYQIQGDVALIGGAGFNSTRINDGFWSGDLPAPLRLLWWFSENPVILGVVAVLAALLLGIGAYAFLKTRERRRLRELGGA